MKKEEEGNATFTTFLQQNSKWHVVISYKKFQIFFF